MSQVATMSTTVNVTQPCRGCGADFTRRLSYVEGQRGVYGDGAARHCSTKCAIIARSIGKRDLRACQNCGGVFDFKRACGYKRARRGLYCSQLCHYAAGRATYTCGACGVDFPGIKGRVRRYCSQACAGVAPVSPLRSRRFGKTWQNTIRPAVIERDGRMCRLCAKPSGLSVHHRVPWRRSQDDSPSNLITLCRSCHRRVEHDASLLRGVA